jgi:DtxR family Mn-dependent transcriptional regulator
MAKIKSVSIENFLKTIYSFEHSQSLAAKPGSVARELGISNAAATDMARNLADKNLIHYEKYQDLKLTPQGKKMALDVIRKHRLWETFLHQTFDLSLHEIHREAELLEHQTSDFLADKLYAFLGKPKVDPHGDPIPDNHGSMSASEEQMSLSAAGSGKYYTIKRLFSSDKEFFDFCHANNISIGSQLKVEKQYVKNNMTEIYINDTKVILNKEITDIIYVKERKLNYVNQK